MRVLFAFAAVFLAVGSTTTHPTYDGPGWSVVEVLSDLYRCRSSVDECLRRDLTRTVDAVMAKNGTAYRLNRYLTVTVVTENTGGSDRGRKGDLGARLLDFFNALRVQYHRSEREKNVDTNEPMTKGDHDGDDEDVDDDSEENYEFEGRGKKKKDKKGKMGMMMAAAAMGMTVVGGMMTKMMIGKVLLIAIKALIIAKLALVLSAIIALKKLMGGGGGGGGGGGQSSWSSGGEGGYRRSYGQIDVDQSVSTAGAMAYRDQISPSYTDVHYVQ